MTDIPSSPQKIQIEETQNGSAVSESTTTKIGGSVNFLLDNSVTSIGDIQQSILTQAQFQALNGNNWVIMSGQNIAGSDLSILTGINILPNATGNKAFFRQTDSDSNIGDFETDQNKAHRHFVFNDITVDLGSSAAIAPTNSAAKKLTGFGEQNYEISSESIVSNLEPDAGLTSNVGSSEARPTNYQMNFFIKINNLPT